MDEKVTMKELVAALQNGLTASNGLGDIFGVPEALMSIAHALQDVAKAITESTNK